MPLRGFFTRSRQRTSRGHPRSHVLRAAEERMPAPTPSRTLGTMRRFSNNTLSQGTRLSSAVFTHGRHLESGGRGQQQSGGKAYRGLCSGGSALHACVCDLNVILIINTTKPNIFRERASWDFLLFFFSILRSRRSCEAWRRTRLVSL